jgi:hypothetical protein
VQSHEAPQKNPKSTTDTYYWASQKKHNKQTPKPNTNQKSKNKT